jgi:undecaprenyl-diphosphatase
VNRSTTPERSIRIGVVLSVVYIAVSVIVALGATDGIDEWWNDRMIDAETASLVRVAEAFGVLGSVTVAGVIAVVTVAVLAALRRWSPAIAVVSMAVLALVVSQLTKSIVDRPRPPDGLEVETSASYPSASVMVSATAIVLGIAVVVAGMVPRWGSVIVWTAIGYVVVMAWSRTYLRVHWLFDVIGGAVGGAAVVTGRELRFFPQRRLRGINARANA